MSFLCKTRNTTSNTSAESPGHEYACRIARGMPAANNSLAETRSGADLWSAPSTSRTARSVRARAVQVVFQVGVAVGRLLFVQVRIAGAQSVRGLPLIGNAVVHRRRACRSRGNGRRFVVAVKTVVGLAVLVSL